MNPATIALWAFAAAAGLYGLGAILHAIKQRRAASPIVNPFAGWEGKQVRVTSGIGDESLHLAPGAVLTVDEVEGDSICLLAPVGRLIYLRAWTKDLDCLVKVHPRAKVEPDMPFQIVEPAPKGAEINDRDPGDEA